jgi:hypothetical protein
MDQRRQDGNTLDHGRVDDLTPRSGPVDSTANVSDDEHL